MSEYKFHSGARMALNVAAVLCMLLIVGIPFGAWIMWCVSRAKVTIDDKGLTALSLGTTKAEWNDLQRVGILRVPIIARGIGAYLAKKKVGGDEGINLCLMTRAGKTRKFIVSQYENWEQIVSEVERHTGKKMETLTMGVFGPKWAEKAA